MNGGQDVSENRSLNFEITANRSRETHPGCAGPLGSMSEVSPTRLMAGIVNDLKAQDLLYIDSASDLLEGEGRSTVGTSS